MQTGMTAQSDAIIAIHVSKLKRKMSELSALNNICFVKMVFVLFYMWYYFYCVQY